MDQTEKCFQKQAVKGKKGSRQRYYKSIGLGFKTPREAIDGTYIDKKCPFSGDVRIRGRIFTATVRKMKMHRTIVVRRDYLHYVRKYHRFEKRHKNISCHISPCFRDVKLGDSVIIGECRPLAKTVSFNVIKHLKAKGAGKKDFQKF